MAAAKKLNGEYTSAEDRAKMLDLNHNLTATKLDGEAALLIVDIEGSMKEAASFITTLSAPQS